MNKDRYNKFCENPSWFKRFIWTGEFNNSQRPDLNVMTFLKDKKPFYGVVVNNINDFWKITKKICKQYAEWCKSIDVMLSDKELELLEEFFKGCIGEYFFVLLFRHQNTLYINNKLYHFYNICPRLEDEDDYGVDLTGTVSTNTDEQWDCVFQVKFWNPYNGNYQMTYDILSRVCTDAVWNNMIDKNHLENVFICWLNDDSQVSKALRKSPIWNNLIFIGKKVLNDNINNQIPEFWNIIINELNNI